MTASGSNLSAQRAVATARRAGCSAPWLRALAWLFVVFFAYRAGLAVLSDAPLMPNGAEQERDALGQYDLATVAAAPDAPHLQVALLVSKGHDDLAVLCAAQLPLLEGQQRELWLKFDDERIATTALLEHLAEQFAAAARPVTTAARVRARRAAMLPKGFPLLHAELELQFTPRVVEPGVWRLDSTSAYVHSSGEGGTITDFDERLSRFELHAEAPFTHTMPPIGLMVVARLAASAVPVPQLRTAAAWRDAAKQPMAEVAKLARSDLPLWANLSSLVALLGALGWSVSRIRSGNATTASPSRVVLALLVAGIAFRLFGLECLLIVLLLLYEWRRRAAAGRGLLTKWLLVIAIASRLALLAALACWWLTLPAPSWLHAVAGHGAPAILLLAGLWSVEDPQRRARAWFAVVVLAHLATTFAGVSVVFGGTVLTSRYLGQAGYWLMLLAALGYLAYGGRRAVAAPSDEETLAAPIGT